MRPLVVIGLILVVLGIVALAVPSFTFFTTERVADVGFFKIDVARPHTIPRKRRILAVPYDVSRRKRDYCAFCSGCKSIATRARTVVSTRTPNRQSLPHISLQSRFGCDSVGAVPISHRRF